MDVAVGEMLTIRGRHFVRGRNKNTVVFKRDGARAVFAKADSARRRCCGSRCRRSLQEFFVLRRQAGCRPASGCACWPEFGKKFTRARWSPLSGPPPARRRRPGRPTATATATGQEQGRRRRRQRPAPGHPRGRDRDRPVQARTPTATASRTATSTVRPDLNDDEYQQPHTILPPRQAPVPEPAVRGRRHRLRRRHPDAHEEHALWKYTTGNHGRAAPRRPRATPTATSTRPTRVTAPAAVRAT